MGDGRVGLRERTRRAVQNELVTAALELFLEQGYEATTVEQIAEAAGLSRRSFFRYFATKDDVLAQALTTPGEALALAVAARDVSEEPWVALRRAMDGLVEQMGSDQRAVAMTRMMVTGEALAASHAHKQRRWRTALAAALAPRLSSMLGEVERRVAADALSGAAIAALAAAESEWVAQDGHCDLGDLLDVAMAAMTRQK